MSTSKMHPLSFATLGLIFCLSTTGFAGQQVLSVDFDGRGGNPKGGEDPKPPTFSGAAAIGQTGDIWNGVSGNSFNQPLVLGPAQNLLAANGNATTVCLSLHGFVSADFFPPDQGAPVKDSLLNDYLVARDGAGLTIRGLVPKSKYDLYLFGSNSRAGAGAGFSVNGSPAKLTKGDNQGSPFVEGVDYVAFKGVEASRRGELTVKLSTAGLEIAILNGLQLVGELPPVTERAKLPDHRRLALAKFEGMADERGQYFDEPMVSFVYGGKRSEDLLPQWKLERSSRKLDDQRTERRIVWTDPSTGLQVRCVGIEYQDFQALEWTVYFRNQGKENTPILQGIQALDLTFQRGEEGEFVLHGTKGDWCTADSFQPFRQTLESKTTKRFVSFGGRPTNAAFPYYNLQMPGGGVFLAVGWPGQWASSFVRDENHGVHITAGQELTHLSLKPGEEIRSPLIALLFWHGTDPVIAQNLWRRWMVAHNLPRTADGKLPPTQIVACSSHQFKEMTQANETNQKLFVDRYLEEGMKLDYWWMDAGWYPCGGEWVNTGTWEPDLTRFPKGLRAVSDYARTKDIKTILWFEPERVGDANSWIGKHHPEWLLSKKAVTPSAPSGGGFGSGPGSLLNLGHPEALKWLINHVDRTLREQGIDFYRQDFNMDPLPFWLGADSADRQGMTENLYVQGYLAYWDGLRQRHPNLRIDSCASGGRRDDLETLRRAVPLIRSDFLFEPTSQQNHHFAFASWIPYHGAGYVTGQSAIGQHGQPDIETYGFRANMSPSLTLCYDMRRKDLDFKLARRLFAQLKQVGPNYLGDFYPLTPYNLANDVWLAWQYDRPETGEGLVQAFRRPDSNFEAGRFKLRGLDPAARYRVADLDHPEEAQTSTGAELMKRGLLITIREQPGAVVIAYKQAK